MIKLGICILIAFNISACSSSSDSKTAGPLDGTVTALEKSIRGEWVSDCSHNQYGNYLEKVKMADGVGSVLRDYTQSQDCTGAIIQTQGPSAFTYTSGASIGVSTEVTLNFKDQPAVKSQIKINGSLMSITIDNKTAHYHKLVTVVNPVPADNDFDRAAIGSWITTACTVGLNNNSFKRLLVIAGHGQASLTNLIYANANCSGAALVEAAQNFQYRVDNYANGGGQITINGEPSDVIISGNKLSVNSATGSVDYEKQ